MALSFLSSSFCASILPTASSMIKRQRSSGFPCFEGIRIGGWRRYSLMSSKGFLTLIIPCMGFILSQKLEDGLTSGSELFRSLKSTHILTFPSFLGTSTTLAIQSAWCTGLMNPTFNCFLTSSLIFRSHLVLIRLNFCLTSTM